jgi:FkbM family methyltransferase
VLGARDLALAALRPAALGVARPLLRAALRVRSVRPAVNALHRVLPLRQKRRFFHYFAAEPIRLDGTWTVDVAGRALRLPMMRDFPLSWLAVVAFHGYDSEVHVFYEEILTSPRRPRVMIDVGANHGLHALKFLAHGVRAVAVEPNPACHAYFRQACALNGFIPEVHGVALGATPGEVVLAIPGVETYRATTMADVRARWPSGVTVTSVRAPRTTLDAFTAAHDLTPDLVKIDTEGGELEVLRGASRTLAAAQPVILFESWPDSATRSPLFALLDTAGYRIRALSFSPAETAALDAATFAGSPATNFLATPR